MCKILAKKTGESLTVEQGNYINSREINQSANVLIQIAILWLELRAKQPDNPNPERTREILRGLRS